jgi:hypothetical protein
VTGPPPPGRKRFPIVYTLAYLNGDTAPVPPGSLARQDSGTGIGTELPRNYLSPLPISTRQTIKVPSWYQPINFIAVGTTIIKKKTNDERLVEIDKVPAQYEEPTFSNHFSKMKQYHFCTRNVCEDVLHQ